MDEEESEVQKRTRRMKAEETRRAMEHEKISRANTGKPQFPLSMKLKQALPLVAIVVALYSLSYHYTKKRSGRKVDITQPDGVLTDVKDIFAPEEKTGEKGPQMPELFADLPRDETELLIDSDKKWTSSR